MSKAITGGITVNLMAGILVTVVMICGTTWWMAEQHDAQAAAATHTMIDGGVDLTRRRLEAITNDYAWWDEAYDAYAREDGDWLEANIGTGITGTEIADGLVIIGQDNVVEYGWTLDEEAYPLERLFTPTVIGWARDIMNDVPVDRMAAQTMFAGDAGQVFLFSMQRVTPPTRLEEVPRDDMPLIMFVQEMSDERLSELGEQYLISDLRLIPAGAEAEGEVSTDRLVDPSGRSVGGLNWTAPRPGRELLGKVAVPLSGALGLFLILALGISLRARRMAFALSRSEKEAVDASRTDSLTGLMNRNGFTHLMNLPEHVQSCRDGRMAVIYLDVNGFKMVNDSLGHQAGDALVVALARRLENVVPKSVHLARIGGDEFGVMVTGEDLNARVPVLCSTFAAALDEAFDVAGQRLHAHCAIGYAISEPGMTDPKEIVRRSDVAMYHAKAAREREGIPYTSAMEVGVEEKRQIEALLRRAIPDNELAVAYQPILTTEARKVTHLEALVRWTSAELGRIGPDRFISVAEDTGLIHNIGAFVLEQVCRDMARWPEMTVCVNLSPVQLRDPSFIEQIYRIVTEFGIDPRRMELELTEGVLVAVPMIAKLRLESLKRMGFTLALDDFGSGFSSIGYLEQFPFDNLKIDRTFLADLGKTAKSNALIHSMVTLGNAMDLTVTAEGVETEMQFELLRSIRCTRMQGWLIGKPLPAAEMEAVLAAESYYKGSAERVGVAAPVGAEAADAPRSRRPSRR